KEEAAGGDDEQPPCCGLCGAQEPQNRKPEMAGKDWAMCAFGSSLSMRSGAQSRHGDERGDDAPQRQPVPLDRRTPVHGALLPSRRRDCRMGGKSGDKWTGVGCCVNRSFIPSLAKSNTLPPLRSS